MVGSIAVARGKRCGIKGLGALAILAFALVTAAPAAADVQPFEVSEYRKDFDVSRAQAEEALETQAEGAEADIVGQLEDSLGDRYAGIWFDNQSGEFVVPLLPGTGSQAISSELADADLGGGEFRTARVESSWEELEAAQEKIDAELNALIEEQLVQTSLDPRANAVVVEVAGDAPVTAHSEARRLAARANAPVEVRVGDAADFGTVLDACTDVFCGTPLRGGVKIYGEADPSKACTAGFRAIGTSDGGRYMLTAGHCVQVPGLPATMNWTTKDDLLAVHPVGQTQQGWKYPGGDWAKIKANGSWWDVPSWPAQVVVWGTPIFNENGAIVGKTPTVDSERAITSETSSVIGTYACHSGIVTGTTCGTVTGIDITHSWAGLAVYNLNELANVCSDHGDSGGPVFTGNTALGMLTGSGDPKCGDTAYYTDITEATDALGVTVAPRLPSPSVTINQATAINGNPGYATVKGTVTLPGTTINNKDINVTLFKWENEDWVQKATIPTKVNNNSYELNNWHGVGTGAWLARAEFPAQGELGAATSNTVTEGSFTVKDGYRFVSKSSGRCLDVRGADKENGAVIQQGGCGNPATGQNQVFGLIPVGEHVLILGRHSNRCITVSGAGTGDGTPMVQWTCQGSPANDPQLFKFVPSGGGSYVEMRVKHTNKCLTVHGALPGDEVPMLQWTCAGVDHQRWTIQSVDSGPIPIDTNLTVPPGEVLNGQPGYVNVNGYVKAGAYPLAGKALNVNYQKEVGPNQWETKSTAHPTLNSEGYYAYPNMAVSTGNWRVRAVLPASAPFAESASSYHYFTIKSGYQFVFRNANKCMSLHANLPADGTPMLQWECGAPDPNMGQTFTLVPRGNGYYYVEINSTDKCVSVHGALQAQGTGILQWPCQGGTNQEWQVVAIAGQAPWNALIARHSGQCASMTGNQNGASLVQWGCAWAPTQQFKFVHVN